MTVDRAARWAALAVGVLACLLGMHMVPDEAVFPVALAGALWAAVAGHVFIIFYWIRYRWWQTSIGRHLMSFMGGLTVIVDLTILDAVVRSLPGDAVLPARNELTLFVWTLLPILFTWRLIVLLKVKNFDGQGNMKH